MQERLIFGWKLLNPFVWMYVKKLVFFEKLVILMKNTSKIHLNNRGMLTLF